MDRRFRTAFFVAPCWIIGFSMLSARVGIAQGTMAPVEQYRMARDSEIALAKSAASPAIANDADVMVLGASGYETAVKGKNGFVCTVQRGWAAGTDDPQFWNPKAIPNKPSKN